MDKRDIALQLSCPTISMPRFSTFEALASNGERVVVAANGLFLEVRRAWGYFVRQIGAVGATVPFGEMHESTNYTTAKLPRALLNEFIQWAQKDKHVEIGANIVWNELSGQFRLIRSEPLDAGAGHLHYRIPTLETGDHIVIDCHSHSSYKAFFSGTDNEDDAHAVKLAFVVGNCNRETPSTAMRLCVRGIFQNLPFKQNEI